MAQVVEIVEFVEFQLLAFYVCLKSSLILQSFQKFSMRIIDLEVAIDMVNERS